MTFAEGFVIGIVLGAALGAFFWNKYKAKAAADLAKVANTVGK